MGTGRFLVAACGASRRFGTMKAAVKFARGQSAAHHDRGGCSGATVWRTRSTQGKREVGEAVAVCARRVCKPTGWLQRGRNR
jgi:hypothetical protein